MKRPPAAVRLHLQCLPSRPSQPCGHDPALHGRQREAAVRRLESGRLVSPSAAIEAAATPRDDVARAVDREHVESLLQRLDTDEAKLVRLHHLEGRSYGEISRLTGMPLGSIGPALSRAKAKMRA